MVREGLSIVLITHKLREVLSICDRITALREGKNVIGLTREDASDEMQVRAMVGENMDLNKSIMFTDRAKSTITATSQDMLALENVSKINSQKIQELTDISLTVKAGEIVGVAGVAGNGQRELAEVVMGIQPIASGRILLNGDDITNLSTKERIARGFVYIPEDRLADGFLNKASVAHNLILGYHNLEPYSRKGIINWKNVNESSHKMISEYNIKTTGPEEIGGNLSGGNIQRVMIARAFSQPSRLMVAHNPTRGLDIPSMDFVYQKLIEHASTGAATLLISEDLDELLLISHRIAVMYRGRIVGILPRERFEKYEIGRLMSGYDLESK